MDQPLPQDQIHELRKAAELAWADDTRHLAHGGHPCKAMGQCYVTSAWLQSRLGGHVARRDGHYVWLSPDKLYGLDLTGDGSIQPPEPSQLEGLRLDSEDEGVHLSGQHHEWRSAPMLHKRVTHPAFNGAEIITPPASHARTALFIRRADRALAALQVGHKLSLDLGDAFPAEQPQFVEDHEPGFMHDDPFSAPEPQTYNVVYAKGELHLSAEDPHSELSRHALIEPNHTGPFAAGYVTVDAMGKANWQLRSNVALHALMRVLKDYGKTAGWEWGGLVDVSGQPVNDDFAPKRSQRLYWGYIDELDQLVIGTDPYGIRLAHADHGHVLVTGAIQITADCAQVSGLEERPWMLGPFKEWADDQNLTIVAGNNVIKTIEDLDQFNLWSPTNNEPEGTEFFHEPHHDERDLRGPGGVYKCPDCKRIFHDYRTYTSHGCPAGPEINSSPDIDPATSIAPIPDGGVSFGGEMSDFNGNHVSRVAVIRVTPDDWQAYRSGFKVGALHIRRDVVIDLAGADTSVTDALLNRAQRAYERLSYITVDQAWQCDDTDAFTRMGFCRTGATTYRWAKEGDPSTELEGAIPFIYDVEEDKIVTGAPGARHSDIVGRFTPAGIVEGLYEPGGKIIIRSITNMPYTVRHMLELWYYTNPQFVIKSVHLRDDEGQDTKLARATAPQTQEVGQYVTNLVASDDIAYRAYQALKKAGGRVYAVGGCIRDALLVKQHDDIDLMVAGLGEDQVLAALKALPGKVAETGHLKDDSKSDTSHAMGVYHYREGGSAGREVQIAMPRRERSTGATHQDFEAHLDPTMTPQEDLYRRDFTPNAMAVDLDTGKFIDPFGGADDIAMGKFRTLSTQSLSDDPLRSLRALGIRARHGLEPDDETRRQLALHAPLITHLPGERIREELDKLFSATEPAEALRLAHETGLLAHLFPEVDRAFGYGQDNPHHEQELGEHLLSTLRHIAKFTDDPDLRLAALLHDIGKPASRWNECVNCTDNSETGEKAIRPNGDTDCHVCGGPLSGHYYAYHVKNPDGSVTVHGADHQSISADMARAWMEEKNYPAKRIARVGNLIEHHMYNPFDTEKGARRFLNKVGEHADDLLTLRRADQGGKSAYPGHPIGKFDVDREADLLHTVRTKGEATSQSALAINGHDVIEHLGIQPGPQVGTILRGLTDAVIDDPTLNEREKLLQKAHEYA